MNGGAYTYREANRNEAGRIADFQVAMADETEGILLNREVCSEGVRRVFRDRSLGRYFVALSGDEEIVGSLLITFEWSDWRCGTVWWIQSVYVVPAHRRHGVYRGLYAHVRSIVEGDPDIRGLRLYVDRRNAAAQEVYAKLGMDGEHYVVFEWMKP